MKYEIVEFLADSFSVEFQEDYYDEAFEKYTFALIFDEFDRDDFIEQVVNELEDSPSLLEMFIEDELIVPTFKGDYDFEFQNKLYNINIKEDHEGIDIIVY
jgi:hypothetical protein